ncbi:major facilitator superfamily domain-containing protein [Xylariomycetidae sp. FL0641]|nr:major facilitator superfamily domain-containing protein [Xylariomycetidae sp. FL0641]
MANRTDTKTSRHTAIRTYLTMPSIGCQDARSTMEPRGVGVIPPARRGRRGRLGQATATTTTTTTTTSSRRVSGQGQAPGGRRSSRRYKPSLDAIVASIGELDLASPGPSGLCDPVNFLDLTDTDSEYDDKMLEAGGKDTGGSRPEEDDVDAVTPTTYLYLTFDTPEPHPHTAAKTSYTVGELPPAPDPSRFSNPLTWPKARKDTMVIMSCVATCLTAYAAGAYSQAADLIAADLETTHTVALLGVTTFCLGFAFAPMVLAPFSEINGRYPVFAVAGILFTVFQTVCGVVTNVPGMLATRAVQGLGGSVFSTMVGGVIADLYGKEDRNTPMALFSGAVLVGTGLGPLVGAAMVQAWGDQGQKWKWVFWHQAILDFVLMIAVAILFKESRGSVILSRKAKALNGWYEALEREGVFGVWVHDQTLISRHVPGRGPPPPAVSEKSPSEMGELRLRRVRWLVKEDEQRGSLSTMITGSLFRPFHLLFTEPIVFFFSLWVSFAWAVLYLMFGSIPLVFKRQYDFDTQQSGLIFAAMMTGSAIASIIGIYQEDLLKHPAWQKKSDGARSGGKVWSFLRRKLPVESPESRLYFTCVTSALLPIGLYLFGFAAQPSIHWIVPTLAVGISTMGIYYVYLATFNYLADIYQTYASSALAAQSFCRNVLGGVFPLVTAPLILNLGEDNSGALLGGIATVLTVVPWVLVFFGERIRSRSSFAIALESS